MTVHTRQEKRKWTKWSINFLFLKQIFNTHLNESKLKLRYFATLGKRDFEDNDEDLFDQLAEEETKRAKKMDKLKYFSSIGKRDSVSDDEDDDEFQLEARNKKLDKMKYFSSLGK